MPLACASGLYLLGVRGSRREKGLRQLGRNLALPIGHSRFFQLGTVVLALCEANSQVADVGIRGTRFNQSTHALEK